jgi:hypothetical protein
MPSTGKQSGPGRPKKDEQMRNYPIYTFAPNEETYQKMKDAAEASGLTLSAWARQKLMEAVR